ncbi:MULTISPECIES: VanZ family protein [Ruminococcus]|uniref:VanZ like family protein n=1 Tax=Ruminococcus flavefaciens TaxID=1265 RepID=A0A1M7J5X8_RUMFL|nr:MULTISPECIES: VanZ family protein [Ruminococcus]MCR4796180.1 VanZ family protein [Ruminococcus sp.]SHM48540.1 VanZ like family protein [Ruminococcus flavefaciens]
MAEKIRQIKPLQWIFAALTLAVMINIFIFSNEKAEKSSETSSRITRLVIKIVYDDYNDKPIEEQNEIWERTSFIVRKSAHFSIYTLLGLCASFAVGKRKLFTMKSLGVVIFGFLYAASDEFHQRFVEGRSCEFRDMMIDTGGVLTGMLISFAVMGIAAAFVRKRLNSR